MKSTWLFLAGMYLYSIICVWIPRLCKYVLLSDTPLDALWVFGAVIKMFFFGFVYIMMIVLLITFGTICMDMANKAYRQGEYEKIKRGWFLSKYAAIPYYVINIIYIYYIWTEYNWDKNIWIIIMRVLFLGHPVIISCVMVFQSGYVGWCYIKYLKKQPEIADTTAPVLYFMQVIMGLDVISTVLLCHKEKKLIRSK